MRRVLVGISIDAVGAARVPELLARAGCEVTLVASTGLAVTASKYVVRHIVAGRSPFQVREAMEREAAQRPDYYSWALLADEPLLRQFLNSPGTPELARLAPLTADPKRLARILSKVGFNQDAEKAGIPVPRFRVLEQDDDKARQTWRGSPSVAKVEESLSGSGVRVIQNAAELAEVNATMTARPMIFQQYQEGRVGASAVLYFHGKPKCWFSYYLCRNWPTPLAAASALEPFWHPDFESILEKLGKMTHFHGMCGVDWVLDSKTGSPLVLEMNPRPTPGMYASEFAGVDFSRALAEWMANDDSVQRPPENASGLYRLFPQNLYRSIDDREPIEFIRTWKDAPITDPKLLVSQLRRVATHYLPVSLRDNLKRRLRTTASEPQRL